MEMIENQLVNNKTITLDEKHFVNCVYTNCTVLYSGGDWAWTNTRFENCQFTFSGAAQRTANLLGNIGVIKPPVPQGKTPVN